jgi:hypothetical protein
MLTSSLPPAPVLAKAGGGAVWRGIGAGRLVDPVSRRRG